MFSYQYCSKYYVFYPKTGKVGEEWKGKEGSNRTKKRTKKEVQKYLLGSLFIFF